MHRQLRGSLLIQANEAEALEQLVIARGEVRPSCALVVDSRGAKLTTSTDKPDGQIHTKMGYSAKGFSTQGLASRLPAP